MERNIRRITAIALLFVLLLFSGCITTNKLSNVSGPTWVTDLTVPLIDRSMSDGVSDSELRLGNVSNGISEEGLGLTGTTINSISEDLGRTTINLDPIEVDMGLIADVGIDCLSGLTIDIDDETPSFDAGQSGLKAITLSNRINDPDFNKISITILGGRAGLGGIGFDLEDAVTGSIIASTEITDGDSSGVLDLSGKTLPSEMKVVFSGKISSTDDNISIRFEGNTLEIVNAEIERDSIAGFLDLGGEAINVGDIELDEDFPQIALETLKISIENTLPEGLIIEGDLAVEGLDGSGSIISRAETAINISSGDISEIDFADQFNSVLSENPDTLRFMVEDLFFNAQDDVEIDLMEPIELSLSMEMAVESLASAPQEMDLPEEIRSNGNNMIKSFRVVLSITNNSPIGLTLDILLSPESIPADDPDKVTIRLRLDPGSIDAPVVTENTVMLTREQILYITSGEKLYNQITLSNNSLDESINDDHYLEIKAYAKAEVLINGRED